MKQTLANRRFTIYVIFLGIGFVFLAKLIHIQLVNDSYKLSANTNALRHVTEYPPRGLIFDRNGKLLVYNDATYDLMVVPKMVKNIDTVALCNLLEITTEEFTKRLKKIKNYSPYKSSVFEKQINKETYGYIQEQLHKFPGFFVQSRTLRCYPQPMAAHVLGYIGEVSPDMLEKDKYYQPGDYVGISGIEKSYENLLRGRNGVKIIMVDVFNREKGNFQNGKYDTTAIAGVNLYTSLDAEVQKLGEELLQNKKGSIVAIEPSSGEILALVSSPCYDPNLLTGRIRSKNYHKLSQDKLKPLFNRALMAQYPPGSTFKIINALIGLQEGVATENTKYDCHMGVSFGGLHVGCHDHKSPLDLKQSIQHSCNAYYCRLFRTIIDKYKSTRQGYDTWRNHVLSFGLGAKFNSDILNELSGFVPAGDYYDHYYGKNRWKSLTVISLAIGQGELGVTPIQLANMAAIFGNRGYYYTPHIIKAAGSPENELAKYKQRKETTVDSRYFDPIAEAMYAVVEEGTGRIARIDSLTVCGKTGTAQNPHGKDHSIFIAFAPKDNPKIAISVVVENAGFGSTWAAPIASLLIEQYLFGKIKRVDLYKRIKEANLLE